MTPTCRLAVLTLAGVLALVTPVVAHEARHPASTRSAERIDPRIAYPFSVVAGGGGHFHAVQIMPAPTRIFAGTHLGLFWSDDRGLTWRLAGPRFSGVDVHALDRDVRTGALYAATHGQGVLVSRDGVRWQEDSAGLPGRDVHALALDPLEESALYAWSVGHGLFVRRGDGRQWEPLAGPRALSDVESLAVSPNDSRRLYAGTARGIWVSDDGGRHWRMPTGGLDRRTAGVAVVPRHPDVVLAATLNGVFVGRADGTGWKPIEPGPRWWGPIVGFAFIDGRPDTIVAVAHEGPVVTRALDHGPWMPMASSPERNKASDSRVLRGEGG
jgi:hypothetical protein